LFRTDIKTPRKDCGREAEAKLTVLWGTSEAAGFPVKNSGWKRRYINGNTAALTMYIENKFHLA
jgi:hypothetical protein